tara:strand:+ start:1359 stop:2021 length:663 start_codon:yes stop_codon:yes gene_type:complete
MFTRFITACAVSVTLAFSSVAFAASTNFIDNNTYTTDTISGLDWLDVTTSKDQSYNYVSGRFGAGEVYEGYRYATVTEFIELINNYTGLTIDNSEYEQYLPEGSLLGLIELLGDTQGASYWSWAGLTAYAPPSYPGYPTTHHYIAAIGVEWARTRGGDEFHKEFFRPMFRLHRDDTSSFYSSGSFLVRDTLNPVPIPAAAFMFAPALLGFLGFRRRKMQA